MWEMVEPWLFLNANSTRNPKPAPTASECFRRATVVLFICAIMSTILPKPGELGIPMHYVLLSRRSRHARRDRFFKMFFSVSVLVGLVYVGRLRQASTSFGLSWLLLVFLGSWFSICVGFGTRWFRYPSVSASVGLATRWPVPIYFGKSRCSIFVRFGSLNGAASGP